MESNSTEERHANAKEEACEIRGLDRTSEEKTGSVSPPTIQTSALKIKTDEGSKRKEVKDTTKEKRCMQLEDKPPPVDLADLKPRNKLARNKSREDLKVQLITTKNQMQSNQ